MAKAKPLEVTPYDGPFRCFVGSERNPKRRYLVDLEYYSGVGKCSCHQFEFRLEPELSRLAPEERWNRRRHFYCKHIRAARLKIASKFLDAVIRERAERARKIVNDK